MRLETRIRNLETKMPVPPDCIWLLWHAGYVGPRLLETADGRRVYEVVADPSPTWESRTVLDWIARAENLRPGLCFAASFVYDGENENGQIVHRWRLKIGPHFKPRWLTPSCEQFAMGDVQRIRDVYQEMQRRGPGWSYCDLPKSEAESTPSESAEKGYG